MSDGKATIVDSETLVGQVISGRYEILEPLGDGSMGVVFLAEHTHMKKKLAVKVMRDEFLENPEAVERFQREAQAAGHIDHPNVCAATDFGRLDDDRFFLVMEFLDGRTLGDVLGEERRLSAARAVKITRQIASGLQRAHELEVIHRDLKPENIILVEREGDPEFVKITDFGVARVEVVDEQKLTQAGRTMGTPVYMSPEQAVASRADERSDLYTLGIMLFEMLTGSVPFRSDSLAVILSKHATEPPPAMHDVAPEALIPLDLVMIVEKLLHKGAASRYQSATALIEALDAADLSPYVPALDGPLVEMTADATGPAETTDTAAPAEHAPVSGSDAFASDSAIEPVANDEFELPAPSATTFSDWSDRWMELPAALRYGAALLVLLLLMAPVVGGAMWLLSGEGETEASSELAALDFSEDDVAPPDLEEERTEFLDDADVADDFASAAPADAVALLAPLEKEHGDNAHLHYLLGRSSMDAGDPVGAMSSYESAVKADPRYASDSRLVSDAARQLAAEEQPESAEPVLAAALQSAFGGPATVAVVDVAFDGNWGARKRARGVLDDSGTWDDLPAWQQKAIELRQTGKQCERVKTLVNELGALGEPEALHVLRKTANRPATGCGFLKKGDCYKCMRDDVQRAISRLETVQAAPAVNSD